LKFEASPGNQFVRHYLKKYPTQKRAGEVVQMVERLPEFKPKCHQKKKKKKKQGKCEPLGPY
jgi:ribosomal protein L34E